jgi:hypothetical protein
LYTSSSHLDQKREGKEREMKKKKIRKKKKKGTCPPLSSFASMIVTIDELC